MTNLDPHQIQKRVYDEQAQALRTIVPGLAVAIDHNDDSIATRPLVFPYKLEGGAFNNNDILLEGDAPSFSSTRSVYGIRFNNNPSGTLMVEFSPSLTDDVWFSQDPVTPANASLTGSTYAANSASNGLRFRVRATSNGTLDGFTLYIVYRG